MDGKTAYKITFCYKTCKFIPERIYIHDSKSECLDAIDKMEKMIIEGLKGVDLHG